MVLQAERTGPRRDLEPSGEPESLAGKISLKKFGDKAMNTIQEKKEQVLKKRKEKEEKARATGAERNLYQQQQPQSKRVKSQHDSR